ncbi:MAG TPA: Rid family hydrolase [Sphingopyxis sp.]|nr:Rid family hydrolase [Sphingopyxis sp.]
MMSWNSRSRSWKPFWSSISTAARCIAIIGEALEALGGSYADVVRTRMYITDAADADLVGHAHGSAFKNVRPASTMLVVPALIRPEWKVEIEAEAIIEK